LRARRGCRTRQAIEYFHIEPALQFRVVATKLEKVKERA
jgi:hypothetical protein